MMYDDGDDAAGGRAETKGLVIPMLSAATYITTLAREGGGSWMAGALAAAGVALMTVTMLRGIVKRRKRSTPNPQAISKPIAVAPSQHKRSKAHTDDVTHATQRASLDRLMVEVQELTRVCAAQIENRAAKLELLIAQADERLARLEQVRAPAVATQSPAPVQARQAAPSKPPVHLNDAREHIRELAAQGKSATEIAKATSEPIGKVELILALQNAERARI